VTKSHEATPFGSKDPSSNTLHFKAIFDSPLKNVVKRAPVRGGGALLKIGHSLAPVTIWGRSRPKYGLPKNLILAGKH